MSERYFGEHYDFETIGVIPVSRWQDIHFSAAIQPWTGKRNFFINTQSSPSAKRKFMKQGNVIPPEIFSYFQENMNKCFSEFQKHMY